MSKNERTPLQRYASAVLHGETQLDSDQFRLDELKKYIAKYKSMLAEAIQLKASGVSIIKAGDMYTVDFPIDNHIAYIESTISNLQKDLLEQRIRVLLQKVPFIGRFLQ